MLRKAPQGLARIRAALLLLMLATAASAQERALPLASLRSGIEFAGRDVRALQDDAATNPAQLWLEQGRALWDAPAGASARSCRSCYDDVATLRGAAVAHPRPDAASGRLFNLEDRIRQCRGEQQRAPVPDFESDELLALTLWVTQASVDLPLRTPIDAALQPHWQAGADLFNRRQGQLNLSCANCHDHNWGRRLYTDTLSQGHPNGYPLYRLEWQKPGSLARRLRSCQAGVRAEMSDWGDASLRQLSLYLMWRAEGLPVEVPAVRK